jgi:hypothetical protein
MSTLISAGTSTSGAVINSDTSGSLQLQTGSTPTTAVTVDTAQNVGVGVTPNSWYATTTKAIDVGVGAAFWSFSSNCYVTGNAYYNASGNYIYKTSNAATNYALASGAHQWSVAPSGTAGNAVTFTQAMTLDNSGNLLVGTTSASAGSGSAVWNSNNSTWTFKVNSAASSNPNGLLITYSGASPNNSGNQFIYCADSGGTQRMSVLSNGGIANYTANNSPLSDRRLKKNINPAGSYLEKICAIPVVTYLFNDQTDELQNLGVIAQDVQAAAPELCNEEGWGTKAEDGTNYLGIWETDIQYALMKCIQELSAQVTAQAATISSMQAALKAANIAGF